MNMNTIQYEKSTSTGHNCLAGMTFPQNEGIKIYLC